MILQEFKAFSRADGVSWRWIYFLDGEPIPSSKKLIESGSLFSPKENLLGRVEDRNFRFEAECKIENNVIDAGMSPLVIMDLVTNYDFPWMVVCDGCNKKKKANQFTPTSWKGVGGVRYEPTEMLCRQCIFDHLIDDFVTDMASHLWTRYNHFDDHNNIKDAWEEWLRRLMSRSVFNYFWLQVASYYDDTFYDGERSPLDMYAKGKFFPSEINDDVIDLFMNDFAEECHYYDAFSVDQRDPDCLGYALAEKTYIRAFQTVNTFPAYATKQNRYGDHMNVCRSCAEKHSEDFFNPDQIMFDFIQFEDGR